MANRNAQDWEQYGRECAKRPGQHWRVNFDGKRGQLELKSEDTGLGFDELVVDHWLHIEQMSKRIWWARIGDARLGIEVRKDGSVELLVSRGEYGRVCGTTETIGEGGADG